MDLMSQDNDGSADADKSDHLSFLNKAIDDCQAIIRHLDTKAALALIPLGFVLSKLIGDPDRYFSGWSGETCIAILVVACSLLSIVYIFSVLYPRINPVEHVILPEELKPAFFVSGFRKGSIAGRKSPVLQKSHGEYVEDIEAATPAQLRSVAAAELLKVSFIRDMKFRFVRRASFYLAICLVLFLILLALDVITRPKSESVSPPVINNISSDIESRPPAGEKLPVKTDSKVLPAKSKKH